MDSFWTILSRISPVANWI